MEQTTETLPTPPPSLLSLSFEGDFTASVPTEPGTSQSSSPTHTHTPLPSGTLHPNATQLNAGQLPLGPNISPGWGVAGTIILGTGLYYALIGVRTKRIQTFFSTAFLAALGTTALILYLTTLPVSHAVQGAFVVAAVLAGALFGGVAVVFTDFAESLGCLLGGFCLSMWLLTLHPGGLITDANGKLAFIAALTVAAFGLSFSRWTRAYGLIGCIAFSGATAVVLGIDCFSCAGLKEFWAYIWNLNEKLFPEGTATYPLTRGIRVELAVTILIFVIGVVSQLRLWRLIKERRNKSNADALAEGDPTGTDDEREIGRQVEEMTNRERQEWERMYGDGSSQSPPQLPPLGLELTTPRSEKIFAEETISPKDLGDEKTTVRIVEDSMPEVDGDGSGVDGMNDAKGSAGMPSASPKRLFHHPASGGPEPPVLPTAKRDGGDSAATPPKPAKSSKENDLISVAAVKNDEYDGEAHEPDVPSDLSRGPRAVIHLQRMSSGSTAFRWSYSQQSTANQTGNGGSVGPSRRTFSPSGRGMDGDNDSVVATLDDIGSDGGHEIGDPDWLPQVTRDGSRASLRSAKSLELGGTVKPKRSLLKTWEDSGEELTAQVVETAKPTVMALPAAAEPSQGTATRPRSLTAAEPVLGTKSPMRRSKSDGQLAASKDEASLKDVGERSLKGPGSAVSSQTAVARLTETNLPPALPPVALTFRMNEWAKHIGAAETPEPDALQPHEAPERISDTPNEEPAPLDILELQLTAENATPPPAASRTGNALSDYPSLHTRSGSKSSSFSYRKQAALGSGSESPSGPKAHRSASMMPKALFPEPIAEEGDCDARNNQAAQSPTPAAQVESRLSAPTSTPNLSMKGIAPGVTLHPPKQQTLIGMREMLLQTRASGIFARLDGGTVHIPPESAIFASPTLARRPSDASGYSTHPKPAHLGHRRHPSQSSSVDLDALPLSQHRATMMRRSSSRLSNPAAGALNHHHHYLPDPAAIAAAAAASSVPTLTAESVAFDSHQPFRRSNATPEAVRQARLASFRNSVAADLRAATPSPVPPLSTASLRSISPPVPRRHNQETITGDELHTIELQRSFLLGQQDAEAQRLEAERLGRQQRQREFVARMRSGALMDAHREAMRRLQGGVRDG
ncbi:hypothetical protein VTK26DRAFT_2492 [Humicola hyalothermophila]